MGLGPRLDRRRPDGRVLLPDRARGDDRVPPLLHPRRVQGRPRPADRARRHGQHGDAGAGDRLGRRPPPSPRLRRPRRRPALAVALRHVRRRAREGFLARPHGLVVRPGEDQRATVRPRPARRPRHRPGRPLVPALTVLTLLSPALIGGLVTLSWWGALTAFFWAGLVRVAVLHHVTWSVNSLCHLIGERPYAARDKSANFWPLAIASMGESWHNSHHADPTGARHGVRRGQLDMSARLIWLFEKLGWATDVRWPRPEHLARKLNPGYTAAPRGFGKPERGLLTGTPARQQPGDGSRS
ncbi:acyl-CoA desaturase [Amycolatopsis sp. NPDC049159]|uniref:acyl-CoA desaturase n=1 Tax=Amycolatopsis sp. NPDC049159 TaxID=3157210 RepID=UPI0033EC51B3